MSKNNKRFSVRLLRHSKRICSRIFSTICKECKSYIPLCYPMGTPMRRRRSFPGNSGIVRAINRFRANNLPEAELLEDRFNYNVVSP